MLRFSLFQGYYNIKKLAEIGKYGKRNTGVS